MIHGRFSFYPTGDVASFSVALLYFFYEHVAFDYEGTFIATL